MIHKVYIRLSEDDIETIIARHIWTTFRPMDGNGDFLLESDILACLETDGFGGLELAWTTTVEQVVDNDNPPI